MGSIAAIREVNTAPLGLAGRVIALSPGADRLQVTHAMRTIGTMAKYLRAIASGAISVKLDPSVPMEVRAAAMQLWQRQSVVLRQGPVTVLVSPPDPRPRVEEMDLGAARRRSAPPSRRAAARTAAAAPRDRRAARGRRAAPPVARGRRRAPGAERPMPPKQMGPKPPPAAAETRPVMPGTVYTPGPSGIMVTPEVGWLRRDALKPPGPPPPPQAPPGYSSPICPPGQVYGPGTGFCLVNQRRAGVPTCPPGSSLVYDNATKQFRCFGTAPPSAPGAQIPPPAPGAQIPSPAPGAAPAQCPPGYMVGAGGLCERTGPLDPRGNCSIPNAMYYPDRGVCVEFRQPAGGVPVPSPPPGPPQQPTVQMQPPTGPAQPGMQCPPGYQLAPDGTTCYPLPMPGAGIPPPAQSFPSGGGGGMPMPSAPEWAADEEEFDEGEEEFDEGEGLDEEEFDEDMSGAGIGLGMYG